MTIEELLIDVGEDKYENLTTTSFQFKRDIWEFFNTPEFKSTACVEFGTHKGQTTRILSFLFDKVYTVNLPNHFDSAQRLNYDRSNIEYIGMDLYASPVDSSFKTKNVSMFFIDAVHTFEAVMSDFSRCLNLNKRKEDVYFVFDDYGSYREVWMAVNQLILTKQISRIKYIGHPPRHNFGGHPERILDDWEGIICKLST